MTVQVVEASSVGEPPLVVDLDGTLSLADTLAWLRDRHDAASECGRDERLSWLAQGKQIEKINLWRSGHLSVDDIPLDPDVITWLTDRVRDGRRLILATGSAHGMADAVGRRIGLFTQVVGSDPSVNLTGPRKAAALVRLFGQGGYDYVGDGPADLPVWSRARAGFCVIRPTTPPFELPPHVRPLLSTHPMVDPAGNRIRMPALPVDGLQAEGGDPETKAD